MIEDKFITKKKETKIITEEACFINRIPDKIYQEMVTIFRDQYHFKNGSEQGGQMRIANYYVGISRSLSDSFVDFIKKVTEGISKDKFPDIQVFEGFDSQVETLLSVEQTGGFSLGSFDMAVSERGLQNIEFQAVATYPFSAAKLNQILLDGMSFTNASIFANNALTTWKDFIKIYSELITGGAATGTAIIDLNIEKQKTNFEFYATQTELKEKVAIVDAASVFEKNNQLYFPASDVSSSRIKLTRFYNRILISDALYEENYPEKKGLWKFRFDKKYDALKFVNHPVKQFEISKRLCPYISHEFNPACYELSLVEKQFREGELQYEDFIWKHKWGAAGHQIILSPTLKELDNLSGNLENYIAQEKVNFKIFKTDDGLEKIVELRFMTARHKGDMVIVPMARIGHISRCPNHRVTYKIHFSDNNREGYGFSPVIIFD